MILEESFNDRRVSEYVSMLTRIEVMGMLKGRFEVHLVPDVEKGEVLIDSRGEGTQQQIKSIEFPEVK